MFFGTPFDNGMTATFITHLKKPTAVKTKILVLASLMLFSAGTASLAASKGKTTASLSELVKKEIAYPQFALDEKADGMVDIYLLEGENGPSLVTVSDDARLRTYVESRVGQIEDALLEAFAKDQTRRFRFTFRYVK